MATELQVCPEHVDTIIRTVYLLHNIVTDKEGVNETVAITQIISEDHRNVRSLRRYNPATQNTCSIRDRFVLKEQLIFSNKNGAYIIQTK